MKAETQIIEAVSAVYRWLDERAARMGQSCKACGKCCDFERFGHRLYVTTPELLYFQNFGGPEIKEMTTGVCPYRIDGKCSVYPHRFSGCRIFQCRGDENKQNALSEQTIRRLKQMCSSHSIPYRYVSLWVGLEILRAGDLLKDL
jgi:Fe-S-cluster containining protein